MANNSSPNLLLNVIGKMSDTNIEESPYKKGFLWCKLSSQSLFTTKNIGCVMQTSQALISRLRFR